MSDAKAGMMHGLWLPTDYEGLASARIERYSRFLAPERPIDPLPRRAPARGLAPPCQLSHRRHGERTRPGDDRAPGCRRPGPLPLVQVADREDALRYAGVVAHVAQREDRPRVGGEVGDVRLDGGLVGADLLVALRGDALEHGRVVLVDVDPPEQVVVGAEPEPVLRVRELLVLGHQLDDATRMSVDRLLADQRGRGLAVVPLLNAHEQLQIPVAE